MENPEMIDDLASLVTLDEPQLLDAIKIRFTKDKIYTYIGDILIAVNPYKELPQYGTEFQQLYRGLLKRSDQPPHIYAIADSVYQNMLQTGQNQCCVVSGESGAGKTESTKYIVQQIAQLCYQDNSDLHERIVMVNPLLEAFGNAQTVLNNNSSRFGKFIQLNFDDTGVITEAHIMEYLLEKSRVVSQAHGEKNFHIFYYMFAGIPDEVLKANKLDKPDEHRIIKPVDGSPVFKTAEEKVEYKKMWDNLQTLFKITGFQELEEQGILATLAAILHLTDIVFIKDEDAKDDSVLIKNEESLLMASELLMVNCEELAKALISNVSVLKGSGDKILAMKNVAQANDGRDALAKALYGRLFAWTVRQVNMLLKPERRIRIMNRRWIGILDLAGFENFQNNSFEQLCINVANEQLHNFFNQHIFQWEMQEYKKEGIEGKDIKFVDNTSLLTIFVKARMGFFAILDDQMKMPAPTDHKFLDQITENFKSNESFQRPKGQTLKFVIHHYAGPVIYNTEGFLEKNRDTLSSNLDECMKNSESDFICKMFYAQLSDRGSMIAKITDAPKRNRTSVLAKNVPNSVLPSAQGSRISVAVKNKAHQFKQPGTYGRKTLGDKSGNTIGQHFMCSLDHLMDKLRSGDPHFIRCIKPNMDKLPEVFQDNLVLQQLRYTGVLETVKIRRQGYASRLPFELFIERYKMLCSDPSQSSTLAEKCRQILKTAGLKDYEIGKTKVFLRYWHTEQLQIQMERINKEVAKCQACIRRFLAKRLLKRMKAQAKKEEEEVQLLCKELSKMSAYIYKAQMDHVEFDKQRHKEQIEKERREAEKREAEKREAERREAQKREVQEREAAKLQNNTPQLPAPGTKPAPILTWGTMFIKEELEDSLQRFPDISQQIWAKIFYMEKNELVGKVYLRDWSVIINYSNSQYNGRVIGLGNQAFHNEFGDEESANIKAMIGAGIELMRDNDGNIMIRNLSESIVIAKDYINPSMSCIGQELNENFGQVPKWFVKIFDVERYKNHILHELHKPEMDIEKLRMLTVIRFAFGKNCVDDQETPAWMFIFNFAALDMLGNENVLQELLSIGKTPITAQRRTKLQAEWKNLRVDRSSSAFNSSGSMSSAPGRTIGFGAKSRPGCS